MGYLIKNADGATASGAELQAAIDTAQSPALISVYTPQGETLTLAASTPAHYEFNSTVTTLNKFEVEEVSAGVNKLKYVGDEDIEVSIETSGVMKTSAVSVTVDFMTYKNGVALIDCRGSGEVGTVAKQIHVGVSGTTTLSNGDYLETYVNSDGATDVTVYDTGTVVKETRKI